MNGECEFVSSLFPLLYHFCFTDFSMVVCNSSRREIIKTKREMPIKKALEPLLKRWGYRDVSKVSVQLRYYEFELKAETQAGDTAGMEVFLKTEDSVDVILRGFHPFINKTSVSVNLFTVLSFVL